MVIDWGVVLGLISVVGIPLAIGIGITMANPSRGELRFARGCFLLAAALTLASLAWLIYGAPLTTGKIITAGFVGAIVAIGLLFGLDWISKREKQAASLESKESSLDNTILAECFWSQFPTTVPSYGLHYWELTASIMDGGILSTSQQPGSPITWKLEEPTHFDACQFINFGTAPIIKIEVEFQVNYHEVILEKNSNTSGKVIMSKQLFNPPARLGIGDNNKFVFYMRNRSPYWVTVLTPPTARVQVVGSEKMQTVRLIPPGMMKNTANLPPFFPTNPPVSPAPPQSPTATPEKK
jgi:hypothetical protein